MLVRGDANARRERRRLAERPHGVALGVGQIEADPAAVGEHDAEPAPARRDRRARERLDPGDVGVALGYPAAEVAGHRDHAVLGERDLRDRGLLERAVDVGQQEGLHAVAPDRHHELARVVVEQQARTLHAGEVAQGGAKTVVETGAAGPGVAVELAKELDDHVERVGARRDRHHLVQPTQLEVTAAAPARG